MNPQNINDDKKILKFTFLVNFLLITEVNLCFFRRGGK